MPQLQLGIWASIGLLSKRSIGKLTPCNKSHSKRGFVSQFTSISDYRSIQSITEIERYEINDSTQKIREKLYKIDTQQWGYCCVLHVPEMYYCISLKRVTQCFQELNLDQAFKYQCYATWPKSKGHHVSLLALVHEETWRSYLSIPMFIFIKLVLYIQTLNESSHCTLVLLKGNYI